MKELQAAWGYDEDGIVAVQAAGGHVKEDSRPAVDGVKVLRRVVDFKELARRPQVLGVVVVG